MPHVSELGFDSGSLTNAVGEGWHFFPPTLSLLWVLVISFAPRVVFSPQHGLSGVLPLN